MTKLEPTRTNSDLTATERLRALLDECGVEWWQSANTLGCVFTRWQSPLFGDEVCVMENGKEGLVLFDHFMTPEQAVAATLGSCNCSNSERTDVPCLPHFWTHDGVLHIEATRMPTRIVVCEGGTCEFVPKRELDASEAENAKLRELVWDLYCLAYPSTVEWEVSDETYDKYSPCEKCHELHGGKSPCASTAKDMTEECCAPIQANVVADRMRELGVEVDG